MIMSKRGLVFSLVVLLASLEVNGGVGAWRNFTSMKDVTSISAHDGLIWAATSGGLFAWDQAKDVYQQFTNAEGLKSVDLTALAIDQKGDIWTGTSTGIIHIYSPRSNTWRYVLDIALANQTKKRINALTIHGDTVLISTDFGLSVLKLQNLEFGDTYKRFGNLPSNLRLGSLSSSIYDGKIWIAITDSVTNHRIAVADLSGPNLLAPESWSLQVVGSNDTIKTLSVFNNSLYAGTSRGLYTYSNGSWNPIASTTGLNIVSLTSSGTLLAISSMSGRVDTMNQQGTSGQFGSGFSFSPKSITLNSSGKPVIGAFEGGVLTFTNAWISHAPNGPASNQFLHVTVDDDGVVWGASGSTNGRGFYRYNGKSWKSFTMENSGLPTNNYYHVSVGCNGSVWASSWGRGMVEIPRGSDMIDSSNIYGRNVGMIGLSNDTNFVVVTSVVCDNSGNHWMSVNQPANSRVLTVQKADGTWRHLFARVAGTNISTLFNSLPIDRNFTVDGFGTLWGVARQGNFQGVFSLGNRGAIEDSVDYFLTVSDGLPSNDVATIVTDREGDIWVGTDRGIAIILDPSNPKRTGGIASYKPLNGLSINTIAVDPINQKWVGTAEGVIVLSQDGTQQIASYTVASTDGRLIDNDVKSIAIDAKSGTVYFGTLLGLASITTAAATPKQTFDEILTYPNPYIIPNTTTVTIDGLVGRSAIKILSIDGHLVRDIITPGGRIGFWDGKDEEGKDVSSGIYIVVAYSEDGSQTATGKVAVVRR